MSPLIFLGLILAALVWAIYLYARQGNWFKIAATGEKELLMNPTVRNRAVFKWADLPGGSGEVISGKRQGESKATFTFNCPEHNDPVVKDVWLSSIEIDDVFNNVLNPGQRIYNINKAKSISFERYAKGLHEQLEKYQLKVLEETEKVLLTDSEKRDLNKQISELKSANELIKSNIDLHRQEAINDAERLAKAGKPSMRPQMGQG